MQEPEKRRLATGAAEKATLFLDKADHGASLLVDHQRYKFGDMLAAI